MGPLRAKVKSAKVRPTPYAYEPRVLTKHRPGGLSRSPWHHPEILTGAHFTRSPRRRTASRVPGPGVGASPLSFFDPQFHFTLPAGRGSTIHQPSWLYVCVNKNVLFLWFSEPKCDAVHYYILVYIIVRSGDGGGGPRIGLGLLRLGERRLL